jgi:hydrogenase maturation factor HypE
VAVSENEHPHVSNHLDVMALRASYDGADFILYAEGSGGSGGDVAQQALAAGTYELVERRPSGMALLRKKK